MNFDRVNSLNGKEASERMHNKRLKAFIERPIVAWDGEGVTDPSGIHRYVLLAYRTSNGDRGHIKARPGATLTLRECADFLLRTAAGNPTALHIIFAGDYDLMMMLRGYEAPTYKAFKNSLIRLRKDKGYTKFGPYNIRWTPHKGFNLVKRGEGDIPIQRIRVWDVFSYFQCSFIQAAQDYLGQEYEGNITEVIKQGKAGRSSFTDADLPEVIEYCYSELEILIRLFTSLRNSLAAADLLVSAFDGPGAIAATLMGKHKIKSAMQTTPDEVREAAQYAYAGGRFETFKFGHIEDKVYEYDINSAYPEAISQLPTLQGGTWSHYSTDVVHPFALYRVRFRETEEHTRRPLPIPLRDKLGNIIFSCNVDTWIWSPEMESLRYYCALYPSARYKVSDVWAFNAADDNRPFAFVPSVYTQRQEYKRDGNEAQRALKLALNSLYGKMAQRVGYNADEKPPPYHQLEWAGWVTSYVRSKVFRAVYMGTALEPENSIVAFATDAVFLTERASTLNLGNNLGEWEETVFTDFTWLTSGVYAGIQGDQKSHISKSRGIPIGQLNRQAMIDCIASGKPITITRSQFHGIGACLQMGNFQTFAKWITSTKEYMYPYRASKRIHLFYESCGHKGVGPESPALELGVWHHTFVDPIAAITPAKSYPHNLPWIREKEDEERLWEPPELSE